jgi:hypothetical protein
MPDEPTLRRVAEEVAERGQEASFEKGPAVRSDTVQLVVRPAGYSPGANMPTAVIGRHPSGPLASSVAFELSNQSRGGVTKHTITIALDEVTAERVQDESVSLIESTFAPSQNRTSR